MTVNESDNAPFFIVGSGRSGSTLLRLILASHSRICIPPETWFLVPLLDKYDSVMRSVYSAVASLNRQYRLAAVLQNLGQSMGCVHVIRRPTSTTVGQPIMMRTCLEIDVLRSVLVTRNTR